MKTQKLLFASLWITLSIAFFSCSDEGVEGPNLIGVTDPGTATNNTAIFGDNSVRDRVRGSGLGGPMGFIYGRFIGSSSGRTSTGIFEANRALMSGRSTFVNARVASDSLENESPIKEESCWVEKYTETENSYEYILDFGEGCWIDEEFFKGKMIEKGTFTDGSFSDEVEYFRFGGKDWTIDGTETFEGTWVEHEEDSSLWEAEYNFVSNLTERFVDEDEVEEVDYRASGSEHINQEGLTVNSGEEFVSTSTGETYESRIEEPLYMDFSCEAEDVFVFVRGIESGEYSYQEEEVTVSGTFSIDFGDGTCDNLVIVTEDGVSEELDILELWEEEEHEEEECDD